MLDMLMSWLVVSSGGRAVGLVHGVMVGGIVGVSVGVRWAGVHVGMTTCAVGVTLGVGWPTGVRVGLGRGKP
jgi:hypothetical protein